MTKNLPKKISHHKSKEFNKIINSINSQLNCNDFTAALKNLFLALKIEPKNHLILNEIGNCFAKLEDYSKALDYHNQAAALKNDHAVILCNVGLDLLKLDRLGEAIQFFEFAIEVDSKYYLAYSGLCTAYHGLGDINSLYKISIKSIEIFPDKYDFHLSLGISLIYLDKIDEALFCIDTALLLEPKSIEAKINKAAAYSKKGDHFTAISLYEEILNTSTINKIHNSVKFNLSFEYLYEGDLIKGWTYYEYGFEESIPFNQRRKPGRKFTAPRWNGEILVGKTLLVWREQGLGDEILFLSMVSDLFDLVNHIIIECDKRLVEIVKHSFPKAVVREQMILEKEDYDFQIPLGSLCKYFRSNINDFNKSKPPLLTNGLNHVLANNFFEENKNKLLIGICWRSGVLNHQRNNNYIPLHEWEAIFKIPNAVFVNLQYGDCESELKNAEDEFRISIQRWPDIDLKNDLTTVFGIISKLDCVVTAATAVSSMSYSIGKPTLVFQPKKNWTNLGTNHYPWSKHMLQFIPKENEPISATLNDISLHIIENLII